MSLKSRPSTILFSCAVMTASFLMFADDLFNTNCRPFVDTPHHHPVDTSCGLDGDPGEPAATRAQNGAKNNLCAPDPAVPVTISVFDDLQNAVQAKGIPFGNQHVSNPVPLPADRSILRSMIQNADGVQIGEGTKVVFVAFVLKTRPGGAESVNCDLTGKEANDIHIVLARSPSATECRSVTAEMIPHFRPVSWNTINFKHVTQGLLGHPVRITGQLFFDAGHAPCNHPRHVQKDPARRSSWEIHPVYAIDVCKDSTLTSCKLEDQSKWKSFDDWLSGLEP